MTLGTYCEDGEGPSRPFTQQLIQLLFGEGGHNETEDEEDGKDETQSPAHERVKTDAFVVSHIGPVCTWSKSGFNIMFSAADNIWRLLCPLHTREVVYLLREATCHSASGVN